MQLSPSDLPPVQELRARTKALALLDALICPEWEYRYYSFNPNWSDTAAMASMCNGQGDEWFILFDHAGAAIKGLDHEIAMNNAHFFAAIQGHVPSEFHSFLTEPAFGLEHSSFCYWRNAQGDCWNKVPNGSVSAEEIEDGASWMLALLVNPATAYLEYARSYFEVEVPLSAIQHVYDQKPLTIEIVRLINSDLTLSEAQSFAAEISYP